MMGLNGKLKIECDLVVSAWEAQVSCWFKGYVDYLNLKNKKWWDACF
jgi:hypothetical protein